MFEIFKRLVMTSSYGNLLGKNCSDSEIDQIVTDGSRSFPDNI